MATFAVGQSIKTGEPTIVVDAGLKPGAHRFQLVVVTEDGRSSDPDAATVTVTEGTIGPIGPLRDTILVTPVIPVRDVIPR